MPTRSPQRPWEANDELWLIDLTTLAVVDQRRLDVALRVRKWDLAHI